MKEEDLMWHVALTAETRRVGLIQLQETPYEMNQLEYIFIDWNKY
jgi:hypothetical protein